MARKARTEVIYKGTFISDRSLLEEFLYQVIKLKNCHLCNNKYLKVYKEILLLYKKRLYNLLKTENSTCPFNTKPVYFFDQMAVKHTDPYWRKMIQKMF